MTRRDFERLAEVFADVDEMLHDEHDWLRDSGTATWGTLRARVADALADSNPRFNRDRWMAATER